MLDEKRQPLKQHNIDTEAGMLLGISQKHNMRSSPCRFTEFCNSQCLSHFAAPFIVVRTETSIAESCELHMAIAIDRRLHQADLRYAVAVGTNGYVVIHPVRPTTRESMHGEQETSPHTPHRRIHKSVIGTCANDPSAGSPTETLLRLLLPLNDKVWTASRGIAAGEPTALPQSGGLTGSFNR